jgi:Fe-S cluster biosynthesis and repair protein YggX
MRYDLTFLVVRFDFGFKTYDPANEIGKKWFRQYNKLSFKFWYKYLLMLINSYFCSLELKQKTKKKIKWDTISNRA